MHRAPDTLQRAMSSLLRRMLPVLRAAARLPARTVAAGAFDPLTWNPSKDPVPTLTDAQVCRARLAMRTAFCNSREPAMRRCRSASASASESHKSNGGSLSNVIE